MTSFVEPTSSDSADNVPTTPLLPAKRRTGWRIGVVMGVLIGLWVIPPVRYTLSAQLEFALSENAVPWVRALDARRSIREAPRLDAVASANPDDYLMQIGRATALANATDVHISATSLSPLADAERDRVLFRLGLIANNFPNAPGSYAHLARYMMVDRVRIQRVEIDGASAPPTAPEKSNHLPGAPRGAAGNLITRSIPAGRLDVRLMEWTLRQGEKRDPDNAFWPTMLATTYFAAEHDQEALAALSRARVRTRWDAYIYEEVLGQWRLYSKTYGENGATQKIGPLSLVAFPHLHEIRRMAEMARWHAERAADAGDIEEAIRIRRNIAWLGLLMREKAQWAYEALFGTDLLFISSTQSDVRLTQDSFRTIGEWEHAAQGYLTLLATSHHNEDILWLHREVETSCGLRQRVDLARFDASYPGMPPGIPLVALFGSWIAGVSLVQQIITLSLTCLLAALWHRRLLRVGAPAYLARTLGAVLVVGITVLSGVLLFFGVPSPHTALVFLIGVVALLLNGMERLSRKLRERRSSQAGAERLEPDLLSREQEAESRWTWRTTVWMVVGIALPGLIALFLLEPRLSSFHPIAVLLSSLVGTNRSATAGEAVELALLAGAMPLSLVLAAGFWALRARVSPHVSALVALQRTAVPMIACLALAYVLLLNRTLQLDAAASRAINEAAENDLHWVLAHSDPATGDN